MEMQQSVKRRNLFFYKDHRILQLLLLVQKKLFWAFNIASNFCFLILVFCRRKIYEVPEDEERHIRHIYYASPQAFNLPCHSSNHSKFFVCVLPDNRGTICLCILFPQFYPSLFLDFTFFFHKLLLSEPEISNSAVQNTAQRYSKFVKLIPNTAKLMHSSYYFLHFTWVCIHQHWISSAILLLIQLLCTYKILPRVSPNHN